MRTSHVPQLFSCTILKYCSHLQLQLQQKRKSWVLQAEQMEANGIQATGFEMAPIQGQEPMSVSVRNSTGSLKPHVSFVLQDTRRSIHQRSIQVCAWCQIKLASSSVMKPTKQGDGKMSLKCMTPTRVE